VAREPARVAYVLKRYPRLSETFILNEILGVERTGLPVRILASKDPKEPKVHEAVSRVRAEVTYMRDAARRAGHDGPEEIAEGRVVSETFRREGLTHLHAHFATHAAGVARAAWRDCGVPYSFTAHAKDIFTDEVDRGRLAGLLCDARFVVAISEYHRRFLLDVEPRARVEVVRNGIDIEAWEKGSDPFFAKKGSDPLSIVAAGRLVAKKGFDDLVRACALLRDRGVPFTCRVLGDGDERPHLQALVDTLDLAGLVTLAGAVTQDELKVDLRRADAFAAPCVTTPSGDRDGLPTVILEAMAAGVPVVATPVTAIPEIVRDGETGLLVPERGWERLADALAALHADRGLGLRLARAAREAVSELHDHARNAARLAKLFAGAA
jgi:glycosyltransferase involved in cell wall biosynthesis